MQSTAKSTQASKSAEIVAAARKYFLQHGFRGVTMDDLAAETGMSKRTLYEHFTSKQELVTAVINNKISDFEARMDSLPTGAKSDFDKTLRSLLVCLQDNTREVSPVFVRDLAREMPEMVVTLRARRKKLVSRTFGRIFRQGRKCGSIRSDIPVDLMVEMLLAVVDTLVTPERMAEKGQSPSQLFQPILAIFLEGVLSDKGRHSL